MFVPTTALKKIANLTKRIHGIQGGTSASKTISILQILIHLCQTDTSPQLTSVTSESVPHLKRGSIRDFKSIMMEHNYWKAKRWNATDFVYTFETGSPLEFFSCDMPYKVRGPRRKRLFINEANNIPYETFDQLEVRTEKEIWLDWNPVIPFWWHEDGDNYTAVYRREDADELILTYKDNEGLPESIVRSIEMRKNNKNWWTIFGLGQLGIPEGRIYTNWEVIEEIPHEARLWRYGLDFGYSNDPSAGVAVYEYNGGHILDEVLYQKGMSNKQIADTFLNYERALIVADSAEPKSIDEIRMYGLNVVPSQKGKDSILNGIQFVQDQRIWVTKRSVNLLKEYRNYLWMTDRDGRIINEPSDVFNHLMDSLRYALANGKQQPAWKPNNPGGVQPYIPGTLI